MFATVFLSLAATLTAPEVKDPPKKEEPTIVGSWKAESGMAGGMKLPLPDSGVTFTFAADGKVTVIEGTEGKADTGTYKLDAKKSPMTLDLIPPEEKKGKIAQGIVKVEGDTLTICFAKEGDRPTAFEAKEGQASILIVMKRVKK